MTERRTVQSLARCNWGAQASQERGIVWGKNFAVQADLQLGANIGADIEAVHTRHICTFTADCVKDGRISQWRRFAQALATPKDDTR